METPAGFAIELEIETVAVGVEVAGRSVEVVSVLREVVAVNKIVAGVVRRVDVNHFDFAEVTLLQNFQSFEVVAFDVKIFSGVEVAAFVECGAQSFVGRSVSLQLGVLLADEIKFVSFLAGGAFARKNLLEAFEVDGATNFSVVVEGFGDTFGENFFQLVEVGHGFSFTIKMQ